MALVTASRREGADTTRRGWPWSLPQEDRVLPFATSWRTNVTLRQLAPLFGISKSSADRITNHPVVIDAGHRLVVAVGQAIPHRRDPGRHPGYGQRVNRPLASAVLTEIILTNSLWPGGWHPLRSVGYVVQS